MANDLIPEEELLKKRIPHFLSFWPFYFYFLTYIVGSSILLWKFSLFEAWIKNSILYAFFGDSSISIIFILTWGGLLLLPALVFSIMKIEWKWVIGFVLISSIGTFLFYRYNFVNKSLLLYSTIGLGVLGLVLSDVYRRSHRYYLTTFRIITKLGFFGSSTRQVPYSKVTDLNTKSGLLGNIFNYGSVIHATASSLGTGSDEASVKVGIGGGASEDVKGTEAGMGVGASVEGGRGVTVPRSRSYFILFGIPRPKEIEKLISKKMREKESAYQIESQTKILGKKLDELIEEDKKENKETSEEKKKKNK